MDKNNKCFSIHEPIDYIQEQYNRFALVSHRRHVEMLDTNDTNTLIVSCDWLLWQECLKNGLHCIYFEAGLLDWSDNNSLNPDLVLMANEWMLVKDEDITRFNGVSLGRLYNAHIVQFIANYIRLERSIRNLTKKYRPEELFLYDYRTEFGYLDSYVNKSIVLSVANEFGIKVTDLYDPLSPNDPDSPVYPTYGVFTNETSKLKILRAIYGKLMENVSRIRCLSGNQRNKILFLVGSKTAFSLINSFDSKKIRPVFFSQSIPKKIKFLFDSIRKGILFVSSSAVQLNENDKRKVNSIIASVRSAWSSPSKGLEEAIRHYVRVNILDKNLLYKMAMQVKETQHLIDRLKPDRVFVDGFRNPPMGIYVALAHQRKIPVDYIWHSPIIPQNSKYGELGCDKRVNRLVDRCLTWGKSNEDWLDNIGAKTLRMRSGSPFNDHFRNLSSTFSGKQKRRCVLVLQYTPTGTDCKGLSSKQYSYYVDVVRALRDMGYLDIHVKLHPGAWRKEYFERISEFYGLNSEVYRLESFKECVEWADFVIGPVMSGAMLEVLASGKNYYAFLLEPHSFDVKYYDKIHLLKDVKSLQNAIENNEYVDRKAILNDFCSFDEIPNVSKRIWEILNSDIS